MTRARDLAKGTFSGDLTVDTNTLVVDSANNRVGVGTASPVNKVTVNGGVSILPYYETYLVNSYYSGGWKYAGNGHAWGIGNNFNGPANGVTIGIAPVNAGGAGAALTWNPAFNIDSAGAVTMPYQPAFLARPASAQLNLPAGGSTLILFGSVSYDQNADFASSVFTAPVTGKYYLDVSLRIDNIDTAASYYELKLLTSNRTYYNLQRFNGMSEDPSYWNMQSSAVADMDAGDTASIVMNIPNGTSQADVSTESHFCGYLVC